MARIFICYRREDASGHAGRLRDALSARFGDGEIFRDIETIGPGEDFVQAMTHAIAGCRVFLTVIGRDWLTVEGPDGRARLLDPDDHVRREIVAALSRGVRVIPVLVEGAAVPRAQEMPEDIRALASRNAVALDDPGWSADLERLIAAIRAELGAPDMVVSPPAQPTVPPARPTMAPTPSAGEVRTRQPRVVLRRVAPAAVILVLAVAALAALDNLRGGDDDPGSGDPGTETAVVGGDPNDDGPAVPAGGRAVTLPRGGAVELDEALYEILAATVAPDTSGATLALRIRLTNRSRYATSFSRDGFRLVHGDRADAPDNQFYEVVEAATTQDGEFTFAVPRATRTATLRVTQGSATGEVPLDLTGRRGPTAARDRLARSQGAHEFEVPFDAARARMPFDEVGLTVRAARLRRYTNKLELSLDVRNDNRSRYDVRFGDEQFRLVVEGVPSVPVSGLSDVVPAASAKDATIVFDLPFGVRDVVLRVTVGDASADLPLRLPDVD